MTTGTQLSSQVALGPRTCEHMGVSEDRVKLFGAPFKGSPFYLGLGAPTHIEGVSGYFPTSFVFGSMVADVWEELLLRGCEVAVC